MDRRRVLCSLLFQCGSQLGYIGLRLRKRHAVTGNNDYFFCLLECCAHLLQS
jgi:hypothetical protein